MSGDLYRDNTAEAFWLPRADPNPSPDDWALAAEAAQQILPPEARGQRVLELTLGEEQFGPHHFRLSRAKNAYYMLKPALPRALTRRMKKWYGRHREDASHLGWPVEDRYVRYRFETARRLLDVTRRDELPVSELWPDGHRYAFALTHDIETGKGQAFAHRVADLDASYGFRSSFNFVPEAYPLDMNLMEDLRARGFEIGVHGLRHDGRDLSSRREFLRRAARINRRLKEFGAVGFRSPLTHRHPDWMQALEIEYDSSFFDTDPYEPIGGGTMSIWPFQLGRFVELPYTLAQDSTLSNVLGEQTASLWLEKVAFLREHHGLVLLNTHPDYLKKETTWSIYEEFLRTMRDRADFFHALPREVARWWRARPQEGVTSFLRREGGGLQIISRPAPASPRGRYAASTADAKRSA